MVVTLWRDAGRTEYNMFHPRRHDLPPGVRGSPFDLEDLRRCRILNLSFEGTVYSVNKNRMAVVRARDRHSLGFRRWLGCKGGRVHM